MRSQLFIATGYLAMVAGWMSFEVQRHEAARQLWTIGLDVARNADNPEDTDLSAYLLYDMALQAVELNRPGEALRLAQIGQAIAPGEYQVSGSTSCSLAFIQARAHAVQGSAAASDRALGQAADQFESIDHSSRPLWGSFLDEAGASCRIPGRRAGGGLCGQRERPELNHSAAQDCPDGSDVEFGASRRIRSNPSR